jgi:hypothetical protein
MKSALLTVTVVLILRTAAAADYRSDWDALHFYNEVQTCRGAVIVPAIKAFVDKGVARKHPDEQIRVETISMLPVFEHAANDACYCAVNEIAKAQDYKAYFGDGDFTERTRKLYEQFSGPVCGGKMKEAMAALENTATREGMRLH